jgi:hypothetical protein
LIREEAAATGQVLTWKHGTIMSKRNLAWIILALVGILSTAGMLWGSFGTSKVVFTESVLKTRLNQQLPRTIRGVTIARVALNMADNRLALRIDLQTDFLRHPVSAVVSAIGAPRYDTHHEALYFEVDEAKVDQFTIAGKTIVDDDTTARSRLTEAVGPAVQRIAEGAARTYLSAVPVYRLKNDLKGFVLKAALSDVKIEQNVLVVTFSLWNLTVTTLIFALPLVIVASLIYLLIRDPLWGLGMIIDIASVNHVVEIPLAVAVNLLGKLISVGRGAERVRKTPPQ